MSEVKKKPPIFSKYSKLESYVPWVPLLTGYTPIEQMLGLQKRFGLDSLWVKRDDITTSIYGGNKPRKLEFILADAKRKGYKKVMTVGGFGSNFCVANAVFCKELGLKSTAALGNQPMADYVKKNLLLNLYYENELIFVRKRSRVKWIKLFKKLFDEKTYFMLVPGGSVPLGTLGFVNAAFELDEQIKNNSIPEPDHIFIPSGSAGSVAGLALGLKLSNLKSKVHAVQVSAFAKHSDIVKLAQDTWKLMKKYDQTIPEVEIDNIIIETKYFGKGYAEPTEEGIEAIEIYKETEDILLETTYSGKTFAAFLGFIRENKEELKGGTILFWNTYNSIDVSDRTKDMDYRNLPKQLHWIFEDQKLYDSQKDKV